jgi:hypothetical protein
MHSYRAEILVWPVLAFLGWTGAQVQPRRPGQETFLSRAVFADGRLWLLSDAGELSSIAEGKDVRLDAGLTAPVLDVCVQKGQVKAIKCENDSCQNWTLYSWASGKWSSSTVVPTVGDAFIALSCATDREIVLTSRRMIETTSGKPAAVVLSETLRPGAVISVHGTSDHVFLGINAGEWGGGLRRIDRRTGQLVAIEQKGPGCEGPLNGSCDPVNGIATVPWKPDCIAVAIGLVHFVPHGRIVEVCKNHIRRIYFKPLGERTANAEARGSEPFETAAFFGLARIGNELVAAGIDGVYRIDASGKARSTPLPKFKKIGDIDISFDLPDLVLVLTKINQRQSISGSAPLLVPR